MTHLPDGCVGVGTVSGGVVGVVGFTGWVGVMVSVGFVP